ncbi:hypothetical protein NPIL_695161 [Nephila pilipes]|uniref:Uncharacterized protein n=1 Tax=Nephila pilipes TaxID=299642 RepID=A0A8X6N4B0_NEPPI|nr:hypothetical protein NPIL_695161 [Nephila pilipes]
MMMQCNMEQSSTISLDRWGRRTRSVDGMGIEKEMVHGSGWISVFRMNQLDHREKGSQGCLSGLMVAGGALPQETGIPGITPRYLNRTPILCPGRNGSIVLRWRAIWQTARIGMPEKDLRFSGSLKLRFAIMRGVDRAERFSSQNFPGDGRSSAVPGRFSEAGRWINSQSFQESIIPSIYMDPCGIRNRRSYF